jgi:hypothetical protein
MPVRFTSRQVMQVMVDMVARRYLQQAQAVK